MSETVPDPLSSSRSMDSDPSFFLSAVRCLPLVSSVRDTISESIVRWALLLLLLDFFFLLTGVTKCHYMEPSGFHIIRNFDQYPEK